MDTKRSLEIFEANTPRKSCTKPSPGKDLKDLTVLQGLAEHERQHGQSQNLTARPPATAGYGPAPTRETYMGTWNGGGGSGSKLAVSVVKFQDLAPDAS